MKLVALLLCAVLAFCQSKTDLGEQLYSTSYVSAITLTGTDGSKHYIGFHGLTTPVQLFHINMTTGATYNVSTSLMGSPNVYGKLYSNQDGHLYFGQSDPCEFAEYNMAGGSVTTHTIPAWSTSPKACGVASTDKVTQIAAQGDPGKLFYGTWVRATSFGYDTSTSTLTDYGLINPPVGDPTCASCYRMVYTMEADSSYVYMGVRDNNAPGARWLTILRQSDGAMLDCFTDPVVTTGDQVQRLASDNSITYVSGSTKYKMTGEFSCPTETTSGTAVNFMWKDPILFIDSSSRSLANTHVGVDIDDDDAYADTGSNNISTIRYRIPGGSGDWVSKSATLTTAATSTKRIDQQGATGTAIIAAGSYGPDAAHSITGGTSTGLGRIKDLSHYASVWDGTYWYFSGYPSRTYRYDPTQAWTLKPSSPDQTCVTGAVNPCSAWTGLAKYHYYNGVGSDGRIYLGTNNERAVAGEVGGYIGWYKASDNSTGSLRAGLECFGPTDFISFDGGASFAYSGNGETDVAAGCSEAVGKLFIFDVATQAIVDTWTPHADAVTPGKLVALNNGHLMGFIKTHPTAADYTIYSIDPATGTVDWEVTGVGSLFGGTAYYNCRPVLGPDGYVYAYIGNNLVRVSPVDGSIETAYADSSPVAGLSLVTGYFGSGLYTWGSTHLYRINLWRPAALRVKNSQSTATQVRLKYGRTTTLDATAQTVACAYEAQCYVAIPGHVIGDMYYQWQFLTAGGAVTAASDITKVTIN